MYPTLESDAPKRGAWTKSELGGADPDWLVDGIGRGVRNVRNSTAMLCIKRKEEKEVS